MPAAGSHRLPHHTLQVSQGGPATAWLVPKTLDPGACCASCSSGQRQASWCIAHCACAVRREACQPMDSLTALFPLCWCVHCSSTDLMRAACRCRCMRCRNVTHRFVEELLQVGRPATALAVQRARCAGSGASSSSSSLNEAEVLLRVQLGGGLLAEAFCDLRRHFNQVGGRRETFCTSRSLLADLRCDGAAMGMTNSCTHDTTP